MIENLLKKELSIVQIAESNAGVITINGNDRHWVEKLSRTTLENECNYFLQRDSPLTFDYLYIQSYLVRTYLLSSRINYEHIRGVYQCFVKPKQPITTDHAATTEETHIDLSLIEEWSHLEQISLDRLEAELRFLERIRAEITNTNEGGVQDKFLSEFVREADRERDLSEKYEQYMIKDFILGQIDTICRLYQKRLMTLKMHSTMSFAS